VPFAVPLAVLVAFLDLIPLVGATIGSVFVALVTLFVDFPTATIVWLIVTVVYQQVENHVVQPIVYRQTVDVRPLVVIVSILIGGSLLGVLGALVAIPVAATVQILLRDWWAQRQERRSKDIALPPEAEPEPEPG
jgi:predicted PurR-regulated permease PerM